MNPASDSLYVYGFPSRYGGAGTELHHQLKLWARLGWNVHLIPSNPDYQRSDLYAEVIDLGITVHGCDDWDAIEDGRPIVSFCNDAFLDRLDEIWKRTRRTVFVNCMTWLFPKERQRASEGKISMFLYQNQDVLERNRPHLHALNPDPAVQYLTFAPYFDSASFPFHKQRAEDFFGCGRISRQDPDKFCPKTLQIYEYFVSPLPKRGIFLGFDHRSRAKVGDPYPWIRLAADHNEISPRDFYAKCDIVLQPTETTENWPRIGLEAMASGSVLIVDNRGGWQRMVEHGVTGWLCNHERDFIYYASKMAYEPELRAQMAAAARERGEALAGPEVAGESWSRIRAVMEEL